MKLYEMHITYYVLADDEVGAKSTRVDLLESCDIEAVEAQTVHSTWWNAIPFCDNPPSPEMTCGEILQKAGR